MEITKSACKVCGCVIYKIRAKAEYSTIVSCKECSSEYAIVESSNSFELLKKVEKKLKNGEIDQHFEEN